MSGKLKVNKEEFWENKYVEGVLPWDIGQVAPAFIKYKSQNPNVFLSNEKLAVLGCGLGHDAFYFSNLRPNVKANLTSQSSTLNSSWLSSCSSLIEVHAFDFSKKAIDFCNELKQKNNLYNINFYKIDFFKLVKKDKWKNYFDYVMEHTSFCAVSPSRRKEYIDLINFLLKPGGKLIGLFFIRPIELGGPPFGSSPDQIRKLFHDGFIEVEKLHYEECLHKGKLDGDEYFGVFEKRDPIITLSS